MIFPYQSSKPEIHLFIIWHNGYEFKDLILKDLEMRFKIRAVVNIEWDKELFEVNLKRFYGQNLPKNSNKARICGNGPFTAIIVEDRAPVYSLRKATSGVQTVNINIFDIKDKYRLLANKNILHATNSEKESEHDITLLFGKAFHDINIDSLCSNTYRENIAGSNGWKDINELLYTLNHTCKYVILRNFEKFPSDIQLGEHSDIDLLCESYISTKLILNGKETSLFSQRVQNKVKVADSFVNVDIRHIGDNYYDRAWEKDILERRICCRSLFYSPSKEDYLYSLMYHALIQKGVVSNDYISRVKDLCNDIGLKTIDLKNQNSALQSLIDFMRSKNYSFIEPNDFSVGYNYRKINANAGLYRRFRFLLSDMKHLVINKEVKK